MDRPIASIPHPPSRSAADPFARMTAALTRWVLGWGLLSLHATVFTLTMIAMVLWNIYDAPSNLWVGEIFRRWGVVLAFHAIAVAAGLTAWRLVKAEQESLMGEPPQWFAPATEPARSHPVHSLPARVEPAGWTPAAAQQVLVPSVPSRSRRWLAGMQRADAAFAQGLAASATWTGNASRRAARSASIGMSGLMARVTKSGSIAAPDPAQTWPESPARHRLEDEEFISRFAGGTNAMPGASAAHNGRPASGSGVDIVLDVTGASPDDHRRAAGTPFKGPGQSWVQAATYTWQVPHERASGSPPATQNGHASPPPNMAPGSGTTPPVASD